MVYRRMEAYDKALEDNNVAIEQAPKSAMTYIDRAATYGKLKKYAEALKDCHKAIALAPRNPQCYQARAQVRRQAKEFEKAQIDYEYAVELAPDDWRTHNGLAWFYATVRDKKSRDGAKAVEHSKKACEMSDWKDAYALDTYAAALAEAGNFKEAVRWQEEAVRRCLSTDTHYRQLCERVDLYKSGKALFEDE
jgi:tetratricopeptide (TPR) repeat protein